MLGGPAGGVNRCGSCLSSVVVNSEEANGWLTVLEVGEHERVGEYLTDFMRRTSPLRSVAGAALGHQPRSE